MNCMVAAVNLLKRNKVLLVLDATLVIADVEILQKKKYSLGRN